MERANFRTVISSRGNRPTGVMDVARPSHPPAVAAPIEPPKPAPAPHQNEVVAPPTETPGDQTPHSQPEPAAPAAPKAKQSNPQKEKVSNPNGGIGAAIFMAVLIFVALAALAVLAYLKGATA